MTKRLQHLDERSYDLEQLKGRTVQEAFTQLHADYYMEITLFLENDRAWHTYPVGGPWEWLDTPPRACDPDPTAAIAKLMALPALPIEGV